MFTVSIVRAEGLQEKTKRSLAFAMQRAMKNSHPAVRAGVVIAVELGRCLPFDPSPPGL